MTCPCLCTLKARKHSRALAAKHGHCLAGMRSAIALPLLTQLHLCWQGVLRAVSCHLPAFSTSQPPLSPIMPRSQQVDLRVCTQNPEAVMLPAESLYSRAL